MKKSKYLILTTIFIIALVLLSSEDTLVLKDAARGQTYLLLSVKEGQELTLGWRHSVELQPWEETFQARLEDHSLCLVKTRFRSYGAGIPPESEGAYRMRDGYIEYDHLHMSYQTLPFIHARYGRYWLSTGDAIYDLSTLVPDNTPVILAIREIPRGLLYGRNYVKKLRQPWELPPVNR